MRNNKNLCTILSAVLVTTLGSVGTMYADGPANVGIVRISDQQQPAPAAESGSAGQSTCPGGDCEYETGHRHWRHNGSPHSALEAMLHHQGTVSPDDGWARPIKHPIRRNPVEYRRYWPSKWWGQPGSALSARRPAFPQVYMPTDTTQLGYYYQAAPQWRPNPAMVPPMPWPSAWHRRECPSRRGGGYGIPAGAVIQPAQPTPATAPHATPPAPSTPPKPEARALQNRIPSQPVGARYWSGSTIRN